MNFIQVKDYKILSNNDNKFKKKKILLYYLIIQKDEAGEVVQD